MQKFKQGERQIRKENLRKYSCMDCRFNLRNVVLMYHDSGNVEFVVCPFCGVVLEEFKDE